MLCAYFITIFFAIDQIFCIRYDNYTLFRGIPVTDKHLQFFKNLTFLYGVDFWREPGLLKMPVEFTVSPEKKEYFLREAEEKEVYLTTLIEDIQKAFDNQTVKPYFRDSFNWFNYYRLNSIYSWMEDLVKEYPSEFMLMNIGKTHEGRSILAAKIRLYGGPPIRSKVIVEGGIHAREWISPAFVTYFINQIMSSKHMPKSELKFVAMSYEWYFIPVTNPDGYEYSHTTNRIWRKNLARFGAVDLNRNFDVAFGTIGVSNNKLSETYCGPRAFSEPESRAIKNFVTSIGTDINFYLSFHSYGQYVVIPYGHSMEHLDNFYEVKSLAQIITSRIYSLYKTEYTVGTAYDTVGYMVSGASACWVKKNFKVPYVLTIELRDEGRYGFALPATLIMPTCEETLLGVLGILGSKQTFPTGMQNHHKSQKLAPVEDGQEKMFLNCMVVIFNMLLFMVARFD